MLITSNSSPATGEMLEDSVFISDEGEFSTHFVPESSHTIEIQYISHVPELGVFDTDISIVNEPVLEEINTDDETFQCSIGQCIEYQEDVPMVQNDSNEIDSIHQDVDLDTPCSSNDCSLDSSNVDSGETDLTNLNWLQNITNIMAIPPMPLIAPKPDPKPPVKNARLHKMKQTILKCQEDFIKNVEDYQSDCEKKPPFSYCSLICLAMRYNGNIMTLSSIYSWIKDNFKYYRQSDATWQNSIRHNLSLNKMFVKVARSKQEPGKGGFWRLDLARLEDSRRFKRTLTTSKSKKKKEKAKPVKEVNEIIKSPHNNEIESDNNNMSCNNSMENSRDTLNYITGNLPDLSLDGLEPVLTNSLHSEVGANVIVEPVLSAEFSSLLLPNPWEELQPDILDSLLDSYLK